MDLIIKHIIDIDKKASDIMARTSIRIEDGEKDTELCIKNMRADIIKDAKARADEMYKSAIDEAKIEAEKIRSLLKNECSDLENKFLSIRDTVEKDIFNQILYGFMRDKHE